MRASLSTHNPIRGAVRVSPLPVRVGAGASVAKNEAGRLLVYILSYFKSKVIDVGLGRDPGG